MNEKLNGRGKRREMNELNYASLKASKRLVEAGIVLETEMQRVHVKNGSWHLVPVDNKPVSDEIDIIIQAPSMAEVWRELPESIESCQGSNLCLEKIVRDDDWVMYTTASYDYEDADIGRCTYKFFSSENNPTDALIDLLIWVRKEERDES